MPAMPTPEIGPCTSQCLCGLLCSDSLIYRRQINHWPTLTSTALLHFCCVAACRLLMSSLCSCCDAYGRPLLSTQASSLMCENAVVYAERTNVTESGRSRMMALLTAHGMRDGRMPACDSALPTTRLITTDAQPVRGRHPRFSWTWVSRAVSWPSKSLSGPSSASVPRPCSVDPRCWDSRCAAGAA